MNKFKIAALIVASYLLGDALAVYRANKVLKANNAIAQDLATALDNIAAGANEKDEHEKFMTKLKFNTIVNPK